MRRLGLTQSGLSVAFLVGSDTGSTRRAIEAVARLGGVRMAGVLLDTERLSFARRRKNLVRNIRRDGWSYPARRLLSGLNPVLDRFAAGIVSQTEVEDLLRRAFPERSLSLEELCNCLGVPLFKVENLNSTNAAQRLRQISADLGIVLGTRILKRSTFGVPRLGSINLHKGKVPEYRGMPYGFWELYEGSSTAGVTVHFVDDKLDTGDVIGTREIPIHPNETEASLRYKLDEEGCALLTECVASMQAGTAKAIPQPEHLAKPRTTPSRQQRAELWRRIPQSAPPPAVKQLVKTMLYLSFYYSGLYAGVRAIRRLRGTSRAVVLLYHRVNDYSADALTVNAQRFAEHLCLFKKYYQVRSTDWLVHALRSGAKIPPNTLVIHFDDCYADVLHEGGRLLKACELPATAFLCSGFVGTDRVFEHDAKKYPFRYPNFTPDEVRRLPEFGLAVGAHTVNHANLGEVSLDAARTEVMDSRTQLEAMLGSEVRFFSFPFGRVGNIRDEVRAMVELAGYQAMFAAEGGFVTRNTPLYDIPRCGTSSEYRPLDLMMEIEGLSLPRIIQGLRGRCRPMRHYATTSVEKAAAQIASK